MGYIMRRTVSGSSSLCSRSSFIGAKIRIGSLFLKQTTYIVVKTGLAIWSRLRNERLEVSK